MRSPAHTPGVCLCGSRCTPPAHRSLPQIMSARITLPRAATKSCRQRPSACRAPTRRASCWASTAGGERRGRAHARRWSGCRAWALRVLRVLLPRPFGAQEPPAPCLPPTRHPLATHAPPPLCLARRSNALSTRLGQLGYELEGEPLNDVFKRFKALADRKKVRGWRWAQLGGWVGGPERARRGARSGGLAAQPRRILFSSHPLSLSHAHTLAHYRPQSRCRTSLTRT